MPMPSATMIAITIGPLNDPRIGGDSTLTLMSHLLLDACPEPAPIVVRGRVRCGGRRYRARVTCVTPRRPAS
jgi:hypothetical protein